MYLPGKSLYADVFQPDGSERQFNIGTLTEHAGTSNSLYLGNCSTIQAGDQVSIFDNAGKLIGGGEYKPSVANGVYSRIIPAGYIGDYLEDDTIYFLWHTTTPPSSNGTIKIYRTDDTDEITSPTGITDTRNFDSKTGVHLCKINLNANDLYEKERDYMSVVSDIVINGQTLNVVLAIFSIENRYAGKQFLRV
jgi:hypothetical protein